MSTRDLPQRYVHADALRRGAGGAVVRRGVLFGMPGVAERTHANHRKGLRGRSFPVRSAGPVMSGLHPALRWRVSRNAYPRHQDANLLTARPSPLVRGTDPGTLAPGGIPVGA